MFEAPRRLRCLAVLALGVGAFLSPEGAAPLEGQLLSPGPLIEAHESAEGALNCTQCHQLRQRGVAADRCLTCHAPLRARVGLGRGLHGRTDVSDCGECHTDHAGRDADIVRFSEDDFDHADAGFLLADSHGDLDCSSCHTRERIVDREVRRQKAAGGTLDRTYLGLAATCRGCHRTEDPHGDEFGVQGCESCHAETQWSDLSPFEHDNTDYPLTGSHIDATCASCHAPAGTTSPVDVSQMNFAGLEFGSCANCHADPHRSAFGGRCTSCHSTSGWSGVSTGRVERSFDHRTTGFVLRGAHMDASCASCHEEGAVRSTGPVQLRMTWPGRSSTGYDPPATDQGCLSCHSDYHLGDLAEAQDGPDCRGCHTEQAWNPSAFDFLMHDRTEFPLRGAHQAVLCESCHTEQAPVRTASSQTHPTPRMVFAVEWSDCASCHRAADPHRGQFPDADCAACHGEDGFAVSDFDHEATRFPLDATHQLPCAQCHTTERDAAGSFVRYSPMGSECRDCHT